MRQGIHYADYAKSARLQRLITYMIDGKVKTTLEIIQGADICAVNSAVCEVREQGFNLECVKKSKPFACQLHDIEIARGTHFILTGGEI